MNPVRSVKNQYRGINAHLHSYWQSEPGWGGFHTLHIGHLAVALEALLFPMGYTTEIESSLQLRYSDDLSKNPRADVSIFDLDPERFSTSAARQYPSPSTGTMLLPTTLVYSETEISEKPYSAIALYEQSPDPDQPVAWLELLSPSNKGRSDDATTYRDKRLRLLKKGIVFIELDYLHETPPTLAGVQDYTARKNRAVHPEARPYRIAITDPRPTYPEGAVQIREFAVDEPIPTMTIPLNYGDHLTFDFGQPYQQSFEGLRYGLKHVDYTQLPLNFDRYSPADQARIVWRMLAVIQAAQNGVDLEASPPLEVEPLTLEEGLSRLEALKTP
jgi:hypothetical protein